MAHKTYLMEHEDEAKRLDLKTGAAEVRAQALWAGIEPGMRVADIGCGSGKTTLTLYELVRPDGAAVGVDASPARVAHAREQCGDEHGDDGISFVCADFLAPLAPLGKFDFIWVRFVLEYHRAQSFEIAASLAAQLNPGGILFLADLDHNSLNHFGLSDRLARAVAGIMKRLEETKDFDPYVGRKLYSYLYDLGLEEIAVSMSPHHLIYGELGEVDRYNWHTKVELAAKRSGYGFPEYAGSFEEFFEEFRRFFADPRRFTYTPLICVRGRKPAG